MNESNAIITHGFSSDSIEKSGETAGQILAARAKAEVEARYIIAMKRPRDWDVVRDKMLKACKRPGFAGSATENIFGAAYYKKPGAAKAEGLSVRFAEEARRNMGNIDIRTAVVFEDEMKRHLQVDVSDLENNISETMPIVVEKTVERSFLKDGEIALSTRINSVGKPVYLRSATDDEIMIKQNSLISKAVRNGILRILPGDIQAECREIILSIRDGEFIEDPAGTKKKIMDSFSEFGVSPANLAEYLGHSLDVISAPESNLLRSVFKLIKAGEKSWHEIMSELAEEQGVESQEQPAPAKKMDALTGNLKAKVKGKVIDTAADSPPEKEK